MGWCGKPYSVGCPGLFLQEYETLDLRDSSDDNDLTGVRHNRNWAKPEVRCALGADSSVPCGYNRETAGDAEGVAEDADHLSGFISNSDENRR